MLIRSERMEELKKTCHYTSKNLINYDDEILNGYHQNCVFLSDYQKQITNHTDITIEDVLYSLYYWGHLFMERAKELSCLDAGFEQWHFKIMEQIERQCGEVDYVLLEQIENNELPKKP